MRNKKVYLVLQVTDWVEKKFDIGGVFDTFELSEMACGRDTDVVMEVETNQRKPYETISVGVWIPTMKIYVNPDGTTIPY